MKDFSKEIENSPNKIDLEKLKEAIRNDLLKEKLINWLEENSEITEKISSKSKTSKQKTVNKKDTKKNNDEGKTKAKRKTTKTKEKQ